MVVRCFCLVLLALCCVAVRGAAAQGTDSALCENAAAQAEHAWRVPARLLDAIGRVESGRYDTATHAVRPWPWTINAAGQGYFYPTRAAAVAAARQFLAQGVGSIDVGCMQINLHHHPDAFASLEDAFDPAHNADYAGRFLAGLFHAAASWVTATGQYHSMTPDVGAGYARRVMAVWQGQSGAELYASVPMQIDPVTHVQQPYPFNHPFRIPLRGLAPRARIINLDGSRGAMPLTGGRGRTLSAYRAMPTRVGALPLLRMADRS